MAGGCLRRSMSWFRVWLGLATFLSLATKISAKNITWIQYTGNDGTVWLNNDRRPSLYTQQFGSCQEDSLLNVSRFDAAYYKDNMTVLFHLGGTSALANESIMMYIGVFAYGEPRFNLTFNPCNANINSLCPMNSSVPIEANGIIPVAESDVAGIPSIALSIPDFEGQAILRVFANSTQSQIGCFSAVVTNGATFSHPAAVGGTLGAFAIMALIASVASAIYGQGVPETRKHYAHSMSVLVVFAVFQHIFFTGGLSMNWPSVLVAFWSNFAWSAGMIYSTSMQNTINGFIGSNGGNISMVGSAPAGQNAPGLGGGYQISQIYKRDLENSSTGFSWYGSPVRPGLPLPGNYSGFAGTLAELNIPASNAFMTGFLWFLILLVVIGAFVVLLKWSVELLARTKYLKTSRLDFFRSHWIKFTIAMLLRTCYIAFFMIMFLTMFQFTLGGSTGVQAVAGVVFAIFFLGLFCVVAYALYYRLRYEKFVSEPDRLNIEKKRKGIVPMYSINSESAEKVDEEQPPHVAVSLPWWRMHFTDSHSERPHVHDDPEYTTKFGWLASRFRRSKWWFFAFWLVYELVRACFYGGAAGHAMTQVFGLLAWEIIAFVAIVVLKPFESNRLNLLVVYFLGFSKVATVALSSAFDARFGLSRILTTVIGIVIIVIQGLLTICLLIAIALGAISSYMSITRYHDEIKPKSLTRPRQRFFAHVDQKSTDRPAPPIVHLPPVPELPKEPYFSVTTVRREPKIEDEDPEDEEAEVEEQAGSIDQRSNMAPSRTASMRSRTSISNLPYGARRHRASWSTRDFVDFDPEQPPSGIQSRMSTESFSDFANRQRATSLRGPNPRGMMPSAYPDGANSPVPTSTHRRTVSNPHRRTQRHSAVVAEEQDDDPVQKTVYTISSQT